MRNNKLLILTVAFLVILSALSVLVVNCIPPKTYLRALIWNLSY